jgi:hypothetical protein
VRSLSFSIRYSILPLTFSQFPHIDEGAPGAGESRSLALSARRDQRQERSEKVDSGETYRFRGSRTGVRSQGGGHSPTIAHHTVACLMGRQMDALGFLVPRGAAAAARHCHRDGVAKENARSFRHSLERCKPVTDYPIHRTSCANKKKNKLH